MIHSHPRMKVLTARHHRLLFYGSWLALGLLQAGLTGLQDDEAYYWVFSKFPAWGYFDHPPITALLIKAGYALFPNELGVRLFPLLLNLFSLLLIEKLLTKKNPLLFYAIALSLGVWQLGGFMAVPDTPLIFFTALFFRCYRLFLERRSGWYAIGLAFSIALLFYTKYQGLLVVFFTVLSNPRLLTKPRLYVTGIIALLLFLPHLYWQWQHHWVSFRYHLFESNVDAWRFSFTTGYLCGQLLLAGPLAGILLIPAALWYKPADPLEKALKWTLAGVYIFFLLSSFRGEVEANWTSPVLIPLFVLSHQALLQRPGMLRWLIRLLLPGLLLVLFARIVMIEDLLPVKAVKNRFHAWKKWPAEMKVKTEGFPVVFSNSYQRASQYWFHSGQPAYSQNHLRDHRNNYNFWPLEDSFLGRPVYFLDIYGPERFPDSLKTPIGTVGYRYDPAFLSFAKIEFIPQSDFYRVKENQPLQLQGRVRLSAYYARFIQQHDSLPATISCCLFKGKNMLQKAVLPLSLQDLVNGEFSVPFMPQVLRGRYYFRFSIETPGYNPTHNSEKIRLQIY